MYATIFTVVMVKQFCNFCLDCSYHEVQLPANVPCEIRSDKMSSFEDCRDTCDDCTAIKYDYSTGECHIYHHDSCITQKSVNYIKRDCGITQGLTGSKLPILNCLGGIQNPRKPVELISLIYECLIVLR